MENKLNNQKKIPAIVSIWAVAKNTIKQTLRMKVAVVFVILLLVLLPILGLTTTGDETLKGRLQTFVSYGLSLTSLLLCLLTIIISIYTVTGDIKYKQIHSVITKPIRRYQLLLGKMLGVLFVDVMLLCFFSAVIYGIAVYLPIHFEASGAELQQLKDEFFTARQAIPIPQADVSQKVQQRYEELKNRGELPSDYTTQELLSELTQKFQLASRAVDVSYYLVWEFDNLKPLTEDFFIRFKYEVSDPYADTDTEVYGEWIVGDPRYVVDRQPVETPIYDEIFKHSIQTFHEITIPASVIPASGRLAVFFGNFQANTVSIIFPEDGVSLLYKAGSFTGNYLRAVFLILLRVIFLAALSIMVSTFVSFPVGILVCLVIFAIVSISGFIIESFTSLSDNVNFIYSYSVKILVQLLPQFDKYNPAKFLTDGQLLSWPVMARCTILMLFIQSFLLMIISFVVFSFRELAKVII